MNASNRNWRGMALGVGLTLGVLSAQLAMAGTWTKRVDSVCSTGYIPVPAYTLPSGTIVPAFCVMKYEAKRSSYVPGDRAVTGVNATYAVSAAMDPPWTGLTWQDARAACAASGATLIQENQWLSLAHQTTSVASNWTGGAVGSGTLFTGHGDAVPAAVLAADTDDNNGYYLTGNSAAASPGQRRTLTLPNGQVIWDLAGNAWEWVDLSILSTSRYHGGAAQWMAYNVTESSLAVADNIPIDKKPKNNYNATQGMGRYFDGANASMAFNDVSEAPDNCVSNGGYCAPVTAVLRSGAWDGGVALSGVFTLNLNNGRSAVFGTVGFRCTK